MRRPFEQVINLAGGFGAIKFGFDTEEVVEVLGWPDDKEALGESAAFWYYEPFELQITFSDGLVYAPPLRVITLLTESESATLWGTKVVALGKAEALALFEEHGYTGFVDCADVLTKWGYETLRIDTSRITLDFHHGLLERIQWGVPHVRWPRRENDVPKPEA